MPLPIDKADSASPRDEPHPLISSCYISPSKDTLTVSFNNATFIFHAQWLHDARCDRGPSRDAANAFCQKLNEAYIHETDISGSGIETTLDIAWNDEGSSSCPTLWLRLLGPLVAKQPQSASVALDGPAIPKGWLPSALVIPEVSYQKIMGEHLSHDEFLATKASMLDRCGWVSNQSSAMFQPASLRVVDTCRSYVYTPSNVKMFQPRLWCRMVIASS